MTLHTIASIPLSQHIEQACQPCHTENIDRCHSVVLECECELHIACKSLEWNRILALH